MQKKKERCRCLFPMSHDLRTLHWYSAVLRTFRIIPENDGLCTVRIISENEGSWGVHKTPSKTFQSFCWNDSNSKGGIVDILISFKNIQNNDSNPSGRIFFVWSYSLLINCCRVKMRVSLGTLNCGISVNSAHFLRPESCLTPLKSSFDAHWWHGNPAACWLLGISGIMCVRGFFTKHQTSVFWSSTVHNVTSFNL